MNRVTPVQPDTLASVAPPAERVGLMSRSVHFLCTDALYREIFGVGMT